jgi:signal peptidase I
MNESLLHVLLACFIAYQLWTNFHFTRLIKRRRRLKEILHQVKHIHRLNRDIYPEAINDELLGIQGLAIELKSDAETSLEGLETRVTEIKTKLPMSKYAGIGEKVEVIVIAFALAFAFRAVVLQPFKIPTNSMRPTLHGVNIYSEAEGKADKFKEGWLYPIYYGRSYYDVEKPVGLQRTDGGKWSLSAVDEFHKSGKAMDPRPRLLQKLFSKTYYSIEGKEGSFNFPGLEDELGKAVEENLATNKDMKKIEGYVETGDHLFVNRYSYNFREPLRGDVAVFQTTGIKHAGSPLSGQFYIKRLAGLPGDTLRILENGNLLVRKKSETEFVNMGEIHPGFADVMSKENGYNAYVRPDPRSLTSLIFNDYVKSEKELSGGLKEVVTDKGRYVLKRSKGYQILVEAVFDSGYEVRFTEGYDEFTLGDRQYFMLGDNSQNSLDSRFWGPVPRENLLGTAHSVFWPFSTRWGWVNK